MERVRERGDLDAAATLHRKHAGASGDRQVGRGVPKARRAKTVDGGGGPAPLQMPEHDLTSLDAGALLDVPREDRADRALVEADMAERVAVDRGLRLEAVDLGGLGHDDEDVEVPERAPALHRARDVVARHPDLGDEDEVRAAGETAERRDPAGVAAHGLDDDDAVVRARGRAQAIERVGDDRDRGIEADAEVRLREVVVHGLRHADDRDALLVEPLRHAQRVVAADRDERVEAEPADAVEDGAPARVILSWIGARGPEDRAALAEYRGDVARHEHARRGLAEEAGPAVPDPERLVPERGRAEDDGADRGVEPGCVATAGEDADPHERKCEPSAHRATGPRLEGVEVLLARENGFCFGVKKAVELTEAAAETGKPVYNLGQVVHNPKISERLAARGVTVIKDPAEAKEGVIVIRAHGVPPETRAKIEAQGLECVDATCSLVLRAQRFTKQLADEGYTVIILGTPEHPEVVGLRGFAPNAIVVETKDEWEKLPRMKKAGVVSQSTQPPWAFKDLVAHVAEIAQETKVFNTVCPVTVKRQHAASELAEQVRTIIVVGGKNSANTRELVNLAKMQGRNAYHIEHADELRPEWLAGETRVGLIGGCSTPMDTLIEVKERAEAIAA